MSRYIDTEKIEYEPFKRILLLMPSADVRENVRATKLVMTGFGNPLKNQNVTNYYICSNCHMPVDEWDKFCKHCGAEMRGGNNA